MNKVPASVIFWVLQRIKRPIKGFEHKKRSDGSFMSWEEQTIETYKQVFYIVCDLAKRGKKEREIIQFLSHFR